MLIAPEPVPRSTKVIFSFLFLNMPETISIKSSVSGRGIRILFETSNFKSLQKEIPLKYCMGIEVLRCLSHKVSIKSKSKFKFKTFSDFILSKFNSIFYNPPNEWIKRLREWLSPPFDICFFFHNENFSAEIRNIKRLI